MLKITNDAATMLSDARASRGAPEEFGVRFYVVETPTQSAALAFDFVEAPQPQDEVIERPGLPVYVAPELATVVADSTLDTQKTDGRDQLVLRPTGER
jgi:Fe-S cluster assembly iron-binding protein IscA